jgi:uncharacterized membrane protein
MNNLMRILIGIFGSKNGVKSIVLLVIVIIVAMPVLYIHFYHRYITYHIKKTYDFFSTFEVVAQNRQLSTTTSNKNKKIPFFLM